MLTFFPEDSMKNFEYVCFCVNNQTNFQGLVEFKVNPLKYMYFFVYTNMSELFRNVTQRLLVKGRGGRSRGIVIVCSNISNT